MVWSRRARRGMTWLGVLALLLVTGCLDGVEVADASPLQAKPAEPTLSEEQDRERQDLTIMEATAVWIHPGAFDDVLDEEPECGFRREVWSGHHGFRFESDPYRDHRSLLEVGFDDNGTGKPFTLRRGPMGVFLFLGAEASPQQDGPGVDVSEEVAWFLRTLTTASEEQVADWARAARMAGHALLWQDPAWTEAGYGPGSPTPTGDPPGPPPTDLFRVEELYLELRGDAAPPLDDEFGDDREVYGDWTFRFEEDRVMAVRSVATAREVVLVSPKDEVRYLRGGQVGLDDAALREEVRTSFACLGLSPPDVAGLEFQRWSLPIRDDN